MLLVFDFVLGCAHFGASPDSLISWTNSYNDTGVFGDAEKATKEKGERVFHESVKQLGRFIDYYRGRPIDVRGRHQDHKPRMPIPWGQYDALP